MLGIRGYEIIIWLGFFLTLGFPNGTDGVTENGFSMDRSSGLGKTENGQSSKIKSLTKLQIQNCLHDSEVFSFKF